MPLKVKFKGTILHFICTIQVGTYYTFVLYDIIIYNGHQRIACLAR